jgi:uncharacterized protein
MKELLEQIARALVDHPDAVKISAITGEKTLIFELRCHEKDVGKIIGRSGKTVSAMRTLLNALSARDGRRAMLEVVE